MAIAIAGAAHCQAPAGTSGGVQPASEVGPADIVVTAQKRAESVQRVPMAITALSAKTLIASGVTNFRDYAVQVPNLSFGYSDANNSANETVAIRGIYGTGTTGFYLDDTPLPDGLDPRILDIQRIEVLKGPQGTLYGARSMGGAVRLITIAPNTDKVEGYAHAIGSATNGGKANGSADGALNVVILPGSVAIRANAYHERDSGVFDRVASSDAPAPFTAHKGVDRARYSGGALSGIVKLDDDHISLLPRVMVARTNTDGRAFADADPSDFVQSRWFDLAEPGRDAYELYSLTGKLQTNFGEFTTNTAFFNRRFASAEDSSEAVAEVLGTPPEPALFHVRHTDHNFSQEVRFASHIDLPIQFTGGVFYQNSRGHQVAPPTSVGDLIDNVYSSDNQENVREVAVFGEATWSISSKLAAIAGARWFDNRVFLATTIDGAATGSFVSSGVQRQKGINPKFSVRYQVTPQAMLYATAAKGFRIGGLNAYSPGLCAAEVNGLGLNVQDTQTYKSDTVWSYELGAKTSWFNRRLTVDAALFDIDWSDVQQLTTLQCGFQFVLNSGKARSRGGELEVQAALTSKLNLSAGVGYTDAVITDPGRLAFVPAGSRVQQVPHWTVNGTLDYHYGFAGLPLFTRLEVAYTGSSYSSNNSLADPRRRKAYTLVKARTGATFGRIELTAFVDNLFNVHANLSDEQPTGVELPGRPRLVVNRPRTIGLDARYSF